MASKLSSLIRLSKFKLDEQRRLLTSFQDQFEALQEEEKEFEADVEKQMGLAGQNYEASWTLTGWHQQNQLKKEKFFNRRKTLVQQIEDANERVSLAFRELKKYELAEQAEKDRQKAKLKKIEAEMMDEAAIQGFMRKDSQKD